MSWSPPKVLVVRIDLTRLVTEGLGMAAVTWQRLERVKGIEPSSSAWKAVALPLSYTRAVRLNLAEILSGPARPVLREAGWWER